MLKGGDKEMNRKSRDSKSSLAEWVLSFIARFKSASRERQMFVVETLSLGGKRELKLVECAGHRYLVGCANEVQAIVPVKSLELSSVENETHVVRTDAQRLFTAELIQRDGLQMPPQCTGEAVTREVLA